MDTFSISDEFRRYLALFWHWAWLLISLSLLGMGIALVISMRTTPVYQSTIKLLLNEAPATKSNDYGSILTSERLAQTYSQLLVTDKVLAGVLEELDLNSSTNSLRRKLQVQPVRDTQLIEIKANDTDPQRAAAILTSLVSVFINENRAIQGQRFDSSKRSLASQMDEMQVKIDEASAGLESLSSSSRDDEERNRLESLLAQYRQIHSSLLLSLEQVKLAEAQSSDNLTTVEDAKVPSVPIRPQTARNVILGGALGFILAAGIVLLTEAFDDTVKGPDDVTRQLGLPVLGLIARYEKDIKLITAAQPRSPIAEAYRSLRTNLQFASVDYPIHTLLVTSPSPGDGKTSVSANLGIVMAQSGRRVALVDADLRRPNIHKVMEIPNRKGITTLFVQPNPVLDGSLQPTSTPNLWGITAGEVPPNPSELLGSAKMFDIISKVQERVDLVIVDTPPIMAVTDSAVLSPRVDGVILVVKPEKTNLGAAKQAVAQLRRVGANILGVVLNEVNINRSRYRYYKYKGYYYHYYNQGYYTNGSEKNGKSEKIIQALLAKNGLDRRRVSEKQNGS